LHNSSRSGGVRHREKTAWETPQEGRAQGSKNRKEPTKFKGKITRKIERLA